MDDDLATAWRSTGTGAQSLTLDLGDEREMGGVTRRGDERGAATAYRVGGA